MINRLLQSMSSYAYKAKFHYNDCIFELRGKVNLLSKIHRGLGDESKKLFLLLLYTFFIFIFLTDVIR